MPEILIQPTWVSLGILNFKASWAILICTAWPCCCWEVLFLKGAPQHFGVIDEQDMAGRVECRLWKPASQPPRTDGKYTCISHGRFKSSQRFGSILVPISYGGAFPTPPEKGSMAESSAPPVSHSVQDLRGTAAPSTASIVSSWASARAVPQLCSLQMGLETPFEPILSLFLKKTGLFESYYMLHSGGRECK